MPRLSDPNREKAFEIYKGNNGKIDLVEIASQLNIPDGTVRGWKSKDKWEQKLNGTFQKNTERSKKNKGGQLGNKNAVGHGAPEENKNAERHGFFSKWLPEETAEIMQTIEKSNPLDILWDNIQLQYVAIIRAQKLMFVRDQKDKTIEKVEEKDGNVCGERWEVQQAWDKHATFLKAQSRAMGELRSMIKQYEELCKSDIATELQKQRIELLKTQINKLNGTDNLEELNKLDKVLAEIKGVV